MQLERQAVFSAPDVHLYGIDGGVVQLCKVDASTAAITPVGPKYDILDGAELSSLDKKNSIYYLLTFNVTSADKKPCLTGLSLKDGTISYHLELPFEESAFVGVGQSVDVDPVTGDVFVVGRMPDKLHHIMRVTPKSGTIAKIATIGNIDVLGGVSAYDPDASILYLEYGIQKGPIKIFGFNVATGKQQFAIVNSALMETMSYDSKTKKLFGLGLKKNSTGGYVRTLITLDKKGQFGEIAEIPGYFIILAAVGTLDVDTRTLYALLQTEGEKPTDPFQFVGVNMESGKILTKPQCYLNNPQETPACPWSLESKY